MVKTQKSSSDIMAAGDGWTQTSSNELIEQIT